MIDCEYIRHSIEAEPNCYCNCFVFDYKGEPCGIDPWDRKGQQHFNVWYGEKDFVANSWDEVLNVKLFDGKALPDILSDIENYGLG